MGSQLCYNTTYQQQNTFFVSEWETSAPADFVLDRSDEVEYEWGRKETLKFTPIYN